MYIKNISYACTISLTKMHDVDITTSWGWFSDALKIFVDGENIVNTRAGWAGWSGSTVFKIDGQEIEARWKWNRWWGYPIYIVLVTSGEIIAEYGKIGSIDKIRNTTRNPGAPRVKFSKLQIISETSESELYEEVTKDTYPFDNRHGSEVLTVEQQLTKTVSNEIALDVSEKVSGEVSADIFRVISSKVSGELSNRLGEKFGKSVTRRHTFKFSVKAGSAVQYTINWKRKVRSGHCVVSVDSSNYELDYETRFGLSYDISSESYV